MIHPYLEGNPKLDGNKSRLPLDVPSNHPNRYQFVYNHIWHMIQQLASLLVKYMLDKSQILDHIILTCELTQCRCNWFRLPLQGQVPDTDPLQDLQRSADAARAAGTRHVPAIDATPHGEQVPGPGDVWEIP
jgi:hypothetical protein